MRLDLSSYDAASRSPAQKSSTEDSHAWRSSLWASLLCVAVYSGAVALVWPVVELATDDDFAYSKMALTFAHTGHFVFNGWETAMVGWQVVWGAVFIRLFGYSYLTLRISTIVLGALLALVLHRVLLRAGVYGAAAVFGTLTVVLSPMFLPMAASYMTDVPALLCIVVCFYGCQRALRARSDKSALLWLCGSAALNVVDGTVRQIVWLGALIVVPSAFWMLRDRRGFKLAAIVTWLVSVIGIAAMMLWFWRQPYILPEHIIRGPFTLLSLRYVLRLCFYGPMEVLCLSLPVLVAWIFDARILNRKRKLQIVAVCAALAPLFLWAAHYNKVQGRLPPWTPNVISRYGILWAAPLMGERPVILSFAVTSFIYLVLLISLAGFIRWLRSGFRRNRTKIHPPTLQHDELSLRESSTLFLPFTAAYFILLLPRAAYPSLFSNVFDRYYLPLIVVSVILLLRLLRTRYSEIPAACYVTLLAFTFFSVAGTHDLFETYRACAAARSEVEASGVSPYSISGPWQEDGANQIALQGYLNDDRLQNPPGAYVPQEHPQLDECNYWWGPLVPALHFQYVLTVDKPACLVSSQYRNVIYTSWLPPFRRTIYIERNPNVR